MISAQRSVAVRVLYAGLPYVVALAVGYVMLMAFHNPEIYTAPKYGGREPALTQHAALEILATGRTTMTYHATGYSYFVALVYLLLPREPVSVLYVQLALLPLAAWCIGRLTGFCGGLRLESWGTWAAALYYPLGYAAAAFNGIYVAYVFSMLALVAFLPLLGPRHSPKMALLTGLALGVVACVRPNFAFFGVVFAAALWRATTSFWEACVRALPIAAASISLLAAMTILNPPPPGELTRGSEVMSFGLLKGTYEYSQRWWDWDWTQRSNDPAYHEYEEHLKRIEAETGKPYSDPASSFAIRREAWRRIVGDPLNTLKKIAISTVRIWIFIPTHLTSMLVKLGCALQEFILLGMAIAGFFLLDPSHGRRVLAAGVMIVPTISHWLIHVEPRYSLPSRGVELALAIVAAAALAVRLRIAAPSVYPPVCGAAAHVFARGARRPPANSNEAR